MNVVSYGGGANSTAMLIGLYELGERVDHIVFADTGGERPEVYTAIERFSKWLVEHEMPAVQTVRRVDRNGNVITLEGYSLKSHTLPSLAYGFKSCSQKFKIQPQDKFFNNLPEARAEWDAGRKIIKLIGYDASEERRAVPRDDPKYEFRYPLIEWGWDREDCIEVIRRHRLDCEWPKSSCFFCPAMKKHEIRSLPDELKERAFAIERNAAESLDSVKGLGRSFSWEEFVKNDAPDLFDNAPEIPCDCYDG